MTAACGFARPAASCGRLSILFYPSPPARRAALAKLVRLLGHRIVSGAAAGVDVAFHWNDTTFPPGDPRQRLHRSVGGSVVDDDDLAAGWKRRSKVLHSLPQVRTFVERDDNDADLGPRAPPHVHPPDAWLTSPPVPPERGHVTGVTPVPESPALNCPASGRGGRKNSTPVVLTGASRVTRDSCYTDFVARKNITVTLEEDVARWARVAAAHENVSVSRLLGDVLRQRMLEEGGYTKAMKRYLSRRAAPISKSGRYPAREELHARRGVR